MKQNNFSKIADQDLVKVRFQKKFKEELVKKLEEKGMNKYVQQAVLQQFENRQNGLEELARLLSIRHSPFNTALEQLNR